MRETAAINETTLTASDVAVPPPLRLELLGPLRLIVDGSEVPVRGTRRRAALALLGLTSGRTVGVDALLDALWDDGPPPSGRHAVVSLLSRVRGHLGPHADLLVRTGGGYQLAPDGWQVDVDEVRRVVRQGRDLVTSDPAAAAERFGAALGGWRGDPLDEFSTVEALAAHAVGLRELRLTVEDEWLAAQYEAGAGPPLVEQTTQATFAEPLRERRLLLHVRALATTGRPRDALRAAHEYRRRLADETGLDPTPALGDLEQLVARGELGPTTVSEVTAHDAPPRSDTSVAPHDPLGRFTPPPRHVTTMFGRSTELERIEQLLELERLITVAGPGGIGKTRLVGEVAHRILAQSEHPVVYVALAPLDDGQDVDAADVASALAGAIGIRSNPEQTSLDACREWLGMTQSLVVVDNCEHVLGAARDVIDAVLAAAPDLRVLATSRVPTGLPGECVVRLDPLPACGAKDDEALDEEPAVQLFAERARRVTGSEPTGDDLRVVADVVDRLDGVPLAIELAAARLSTLSLEELRRRITDALDLLGDGRSSTDARHRSLRATLDWSYRLLCPDERRLLAHLAAFTDGADLQAVAAIATELGLDHDATIELTQLVDSSIVLVDPVGEPRYWMPEAVRTFAHERHRRHGGGTTPTAAFVRWAVTTAQRIDELSRGPQELAADSQIRSELGNLRSAHRSAIGSDDITSAVAITVALDRVASFRDLPEVWSWARTLAVLPAIDVHPRRADVFGAAAEAAWLTGDLDDAERLASRGLAGDGDCGRCHYALATVALFRGELDRARQSFLVAADADRTVLANAALAAAYAGDQPGALALLDQGIPWARASGGPTDLAVFEYATGETLAGSPDAGTHYERAIALARHSGASFVEGVASVGLASTLADRGQVGEALGLHRRTVRYWARTGNWTQQWITLRNVARLLRSLGDDAVADVLDAAVAKPDEEGATTEAAPIVMTERTPRSAAVARALDAIGAHLPS